MANIKERREVLSLIEPFISHEDNEKMFAIPLEDEIEKIVKDLPNDKSPSIDGVTSDILKFWSEVKPTCIAMVLAYWNDNILTSRATTGVIKLIPKNKDIILLLN